MIGRIFASEIWEAYFREGLFFLRGGGGIIGILRYTPDMLMNVLTANCFELRREL